MSATFIEDLDPEAVETIRNAGALRALPAGHYLFLEGDRSASVFMVLSGLVRIENSTPSGKVALLDLAQPGSLIGELGVLDDVVRSASASTLTECRISSVPAAAFRDLVRSNPAVQTAVLTRLTRRIRTLSTQFVETSMMEAPSRIAGRLIRLVEIEQSLGRAGIEPDGSIDLRLPINQEELGQWSGLSREGAVKGLSALRSAGLIETGRKRIHIIDPDGLAAMALPG